GPPLGRYDASDERPGEGPCRQGTHRPGGEGEHRNVELPTLPAARQASRLEWAPVPVGEEAERASGYGGRSAEGGPFGDHPAGPADSLRPGEAECSRLDLAGEQWYPDEGARQHGNDEQGNCDKRK